MSPVGQDQPNITTPANTGGQLLGDTPGLFGDTGDKPSCDSQTLIANLDADRAKATAWATAIGLESKDIPSYVMSLTPVVLRSDTAVTSYGYADNRFFGYPAVLQAGTAVFVNSYGEPKAKCFSGNPLTQPKSMPQANYVGTAWQQFTPTSVTTIQRAPSVINYYTCADVQKGTMVRLKARLPHDVEVHKNTQNRTHSDSYTTNGGPGGNESSSKKDKDTKGKGKKDTKDGPDTGGQTHGHGGR
jgi:hypothetical protein